MTKHRLVVKVLSDHDYRLKVGGGSQDHERYTDGIITVSVPRHREISDEMARIIYRQAEIPRKDWRL